VATTKALELAQLADSISVNANGEITNIGTLSSLDISGDISTSTLSASANVSIADDAVINIGTGNDLRIYHRSSDGHSFIDEVGSGSLYIRAEDRINFRNRDGGVTTANLIASGGVELYYAGDKKFETSNTGISVVGDVNASTLTTSGNASIGNDLTVAGNFTVSGNTTFVNTDNLQIEDTLITLASGATTPAQANTSGFAVLGTANGGINDASIIFTHATNEEEYWTLNRPVAVTTSTTFGTNTSWINQNGAGNHAKLVVQANGSTADNANTEVYAALELVGRFYGSNAQSTHGRHGRYL